MKIPSGMGAGMYDEKIRELFQLMDEKGIVEEENPKTPEELAKEKEELMRELREGSSADENNPASSVAFEYNVMMQQFEALVADYERRDAEEKAETEAAAKGGTDEDAG